MAEKNLTGEFYSDPLIRKPEDGGSADQKLAKAISDESDEISDEEVLLERWDERPDLFIEDIFRVRDLNSKEIESLDLTGYQRTFIHALWYGDASTLSVLKGRRTGYSFVACLTILAYALLNPHSFIAITGPSKSQAKDRINDIYDLIDFSRLDMEEETLPVNNRDELELPNGSTIMAFAGNPDTSRGADSADILFIDEMAFLEDEKESMRAFSPFVALGDANTIQISTPNTSNDLFMQEMDRGSPEGENGIISIERPSFKDAEEIDVEKSLIEQGVEPANPYQNMKKAEKDRQRDPEGFKQEYLCKTVSDRYSFFTDDGIDRALERGKDDGYVHHPATHARLGGDMVMGVDIAAGGNDDTAITVFEHYGNERLLRFHTVLSRADLMEVGIQGDPKNPSDMAAYINTVVQNMGVEKVFLDKTGVGEGFNNEVSKVIGRKAVGFDFDDKEELKRMMGDFNYGLHNDQITLVPDKEEHLGEQLKAIVKEKNKRTSKPSFSGKENAPDGTDDLAMALVLGAYPPNFDADRNTQPVQRKNVSDFNEDDGQANAEGSGHIDAMIASNDNSSTRNSEQHVAIGVEPDYGNNRQYNRRHSR
jgi:phage FluMu gp28-like protein